MANTYRSRKEKGTRLEKWVANELVTRNIDPKAHRQLLSGGGFLKNDINTTLDAAIECKNQETWQIFKWWQQVLGDLVPGKRPILVLSRNNDDKYAFMRVKDWLDLEQIKMEQQQEIEQLKSQIDLRDTKPNGYLERPTDNKTNIYIINKAIEALKQVKRHLCE